MRSASSGGRRLRHAALAARKLALEAGRTVSRKELSAAAREAEKALQLRPTLRPVLSALVACWGEQGWDRLLVWPSNDYLESQTGLSERALRYALCELIKMKLIIPKDSPNGKRYAVKDSAGKVIDAFGFDVTPVYARRAEWAELILEHKIVEDTRKRGFDDITAARHAAEDALNVFASDFPDLDCSDLKRRVAALKARTPRRSSKFMPHAILEEWVETRKACEEALYIAGNGGKDCCHNNRNDECLSETCNKGFPKKAESVLRTEQPLEQLPPGLILEACPTINDYGQPIRDVSDIVAAGRYLRASLGAHESAWKEAVAEIGALKAAISVIYVLQLYEDDLARNAGESRIRNPGGYFRAIVRMVKDGRIDLNVELRAMKRRRLP